MAKLQPGQTLGSYRIIAQIGERVHGSLTLYLDKQAIASAADSTCISGGVGLFVWSAAQAAPTDISFDDFLLTDIP